MMLVRTYVAASPIEGLGVYADEFIRSGTLIWQFNPNFVMTFSVADIENFPTHTKEFVQKYSFPNLDMGDGFWCLELDNGRYMNHSYTPNTDFKVFECGIAISDIHPGEEITADYREFDPNFAGEFLPFSAHKQNGHHVSHP